MRAILTPILRGLFRRTNRSQPVDPAAVQRVLLLRYDAIGDGIVTLPMIDFLLSTCSHAHIDVVTSPANDSIFATEPRVRRYCFRRTFVSYISTWWKLRRNRYDLTFSLVINKTTLAGWLANTFGTSATTVTFEHPERRHHYGVWFNMQIPQERGVETMTMMQLRLAGAALGVVPQFDRFPLRLPLTSQAQTFAHRVILTGQPTVVLNLSAGNAYRMLSEEVNAALARLILERHPTWHIALIGHGIRVAMAERLATTIGPRATAVPAASFLSMAAVLQRAMLLVSPDTSMIHAASAVGTPVVGLYTTRATFINEWMPYGVPFEAVVTHERADLDTLDPERIADAVDALATRLHMV